MRRIGSTAASKLIATVPPNIQSACCGEATAGNCGTKYRAMAITPQLAGTPLHQPHSPQTTACCTAVQYNVQFDAPTALRTPYSALRSVVSVDTVSPMTSVPTSNPMTSNTRRMGRKLSPVSDKLFAVNCAFGNADTNGDVSSICVMASPTCTSGASWTRK